MNISIVGAGAWGTALAVHLNRIGHSVKLWVYEAELYRAIYQGRINVYYLPEVVLDEGIDVHRSLEGAAKGCDSVLLAVPSHAFRDVFVPLSSHLSDDQILLSASKGIEGSSLKTMSQIMEEVRPNSRVAVLSGPSFAKEVCQGLPTAVTVASKDLDLAVRIQEDFSSDRFRIYAHDDVIGAEIGGAVKNVIAIATGISDGLGFGLNARAALITRGLAEMMRLGIRMGANEMTFSGLSGFGDLILTCTGDLSRNRTVGLRIGRGEKVENVTGTMKSVAEGVRTTHSVRMLARHYQIEMPITEQVYLVLYENKDPKDACVDLMTRSLKKEIFLPGSRS
jgi:glycerol-3-phosphate dehydrogenase (NAD(P)+)